uniref:RRM domain-containing protein n=1 Tax=Meloidogyne hapla TaxID=6305 RepID=A0A1I8C138_MELHA
MVASTLTASSTSSSSTSSTSSNTQKPDIDQQLYYAQLLAVQQQNEGIENNLVKKIELNSRPTTVDEHQQLIDRKEESERERKEREWSERNTNLIFFAFSVFFFIGNEEIYSETYTKCGHQKFPPFPPCKIKPELFKVSLARPSKDDIKGANVYVSGLPKSLTQPELEAVFRPFGAIITSRILYDNVTGLSKGVGFVRFDRKAEAENAIEKMTGTTPWGGDETISVKFANSPTSNNAKTSPNAAVQSLLPLLQQNSLPSIPLTGIQAAQLNLTPFSNAALTAVTSSAGGGPIPGHVPQHRFRFSPLAGAPLISASTPAIPPGNNSANVSVPSFSSLPFPTAALLQGANTQDYLNILRQQLLQQQLSAYAAATGQQHPLAAQNFNAAQIAAAAQQQYAMYAALGLGALPTSNGINITTSTGSSTSISTNLPKNPSLPENTNPSWTVNISNLSPEAEESVLWKLLGPFGAVLSAKMKGKGVGSVLMANYEEAMAAINSLNGLMLGGRQLKGSLRRLSRKEQILHFDLSQKAEKR